MPTFTLAASIITTEGAQTSSQTKYIYLTAMSCQLYMWMCANRGRQNHMTPAQHRGRASCNISDTSISTR